MPSGDKPHRGIEANVIDIYDKYTDSSLLNNNTFIR